MVAFIALAAHKHDTGPKCKMPLWCRQTATQIIRQQCVACNYSNSVRLGHGRVTQSLFSPPAGIAILNTIHHLIALEEKLKRKNRSANFEITSPYTPFCFEIKQ